jgi:hypothetical protein
MRKMGLATKEHAESANFERYLDSFMKGLMEEQVALICKLFAHHTPSQRASRWTVLL